MVVWKHSGSIATNIYSETGDNEFYDVANNGGAGC